MKDQLSYKSADFFMIRYANFPIDYLSISEHEDIEKLLNFYKKNQIFQEAIAVASFDLHNSLKNFELLKEKDKKKIFLSLVKYLIRMSSRTTPFGLFSSVGWGNFASKTSISFDVKYLKKKARFSMEMFKHIIDSFHNKKEIVQNLKVMINPQIIFNNKRAYLYNNNIISFDDNISINISSAFEFIVEKASSPIKYFLLEEKLIKHFSEQEKFKSINYLWQLFNLKFLVSQLQDPNSFLDPSSGYFNNIASSDNDFKVSLETIGSINQFIEEFNKSINGKGIYDLEMMRKYSSMLDQKIKYPFMIDSFYCKNDIFLDKNIQLAIEKAVNIYLQFQLETRYPKQLNDFHKYFIEKYGTDRLVSFFEIVGDQNVRNLFYEIEEIDPKFVLINSLLSLQINKKEIDIEKILNHLPFIDEEKINSFPASVELFFELATAGKKDIENGNFLLICKGLSPQAGATFGRFLYLWEDKKINELRNLIIEEEKANSHLKFIQSSFLLESSQAANVSNTLKLREEHLYLHYTDLDENTIKLKDIYIYADTQKFFLVSKKYKEKLIFTPSVMTNPVHLPLPYRFLLFLSQCHFLSISEFLQSFFKNHSFTPRIKYKNIIFSLAKWRFTFSVLNLDSEASKKTASDALKNAFIKNKVPHRIQLSQHDNNLILSWKIDYHFEIIVNHFFQNKEVIIFEQIINKNNLFMKDQSNKHTCEFVVPLIKNKSNNLIISKKELTDNHFYSFENRVSFPGSDWLYAKIYMPTMDADIFLTKYLLQFMNNIVTKYNINKWFYIRYKDILFHFRLRINAKKELLNGVILQELTSWIELLHKNGVVEDISLCSYDKEIERYGGPQCLPFVEEFFCKDSLVCIKLLENDDGFFPKYLLATFGIINILRYFYSDFNQIGHFFSFEKQQKNLLSGIRPYSKIALEYILNLFFPDLAEPLENSRIDNLKKCFSHLFPVLDNLSDKINKLKKENNLFTSYDSLIDSLIHMHCNRLLGTDHSLEIKARVSAGYFLGKIYILNNNKLKKNNGSTYV